MALTGGQWQKLTDALAHAYPSLDALGMMLKFRCEVSLSDIAAPGPLPTVVYRVIEDAEAKGWTARLIAGARESNPGNPQLAAVAAEIGLAVVAPAAPELEVLITAEQGFLNPVTWRERLSLLEGQICQISYPAANGGSISGTGCLVAPDLVLTNEHVITRLREEAGLVPEVKVRFDYKALDDGTVVAPGVEFQLAQNGWLEDWSPPSQVDLLTDQGAQVPGPQELDYALLRVAGEPGNQTLGTTSQPGAPTRGWITELAPPVAAETFLFILQHPLAKPLALAGDRVTAVNGNATRIRYRTNTEHGSSGAPCFDINWRLAALHHLGDPGFSTMSRADYNEGVPMPAILGLLEERQHRQKLFPART
jgi:Effector-associated domain 1/Trypsin-like peptidase domain